MIKKEPQKTVYVAMSGGVDSSVAAALLKRDGFRIVGVFMKPWQEPGIECLWEKDREDALRVAAILDIPLLTWDFSKEYERSVTRYMLDAYRRGITPNPDVMCNKEIKFGLFLRKALKEGADYIATGHYARIAERKVDSKKRKGHKDKKLFTSHFSLLTAVDSNKDQTYFLWTLTQEQLRKTLFPVGKYTKPQVRTLAKKFKLPVFNKKDSQGVCFIGPLDMKSFLQRHIPSKKGIVKHIDGRILGGHDGASYYTIGQRHGLNLGIAGGPYYVIDRDMKRNTITVGDEKDLLQQRVKISDLHFITTRFPARTTGVARSGRRPTVINAKIRYRTPAGSARLKGKQLFFKKPQRAITPGQSAVFYHGQEVVGGGIIVA